MSGTKRRIDFLGRTLEELRSWPKEATSRVGAELRRVQWNLEPSDWKPMKSVGQGVREIRVHTGDGAYRVVYVAKFEGVVHVLHAFVKKSQKTEQRELDKAKRAYADLLRSATR